MVKYDNHISLGHIFNVATLIIGIGISWGVHQQTLTQLSTDLKLHSEKLEVHRDMINQLQRNEVQYSSDITYMKSALTEMKSDIREVKGAVVQ